MDKREDPGQTQTQKGNLKKMETNRSNLKRIQRHHTSIQGPR